MVGIPTTIVCRNGFDTVTINGFAGLGFPAEAPITYIFPTEMFLVGSDLTPLSEHMEEMLQGLTSWEPVTKEKGLVEPDMLTYAGADFYSAFRTMNNMFSRSSLRDSFPVVPPTEEIVDWILTGTDMSPDTQLGAIYPRGGIMTVRYAAVHLAMAGGRPEYLPVFIAMLQIVCNEDFLTRTWNSTTCGVWPAFVINGDVAKDIRMSSGYGCLGPDPQHPSAGVLGRAMRISLQTIGGATPGSGTMSIYGGPRYANAVFAEDEEGLPDTWKTVAEEYGFKRGANVVTGTACSSQENVHWAGIGDTDTNLKSLNVACGRLRAPNANVLVGDMSIPGRCGGLLLMGRTLAASLAQENGFTKDDIKQYLWENSKMPLEEALSYGLGSRIEKQKGYGALTDADTMIPYVYDPSQIMIAVAGGDQSNHGFWMQPATESINCSYEIQLPANWDDLLLDAEIDLGPKPSGH